MQRNIFHHQLSHVHFYDICDSRYVCTIQLCSLCSIGIERVQLRQVSLTTTIFGLLQMHCYRYKCVVCLSFKKKKEKDKKDLVHILWLGIDWPIENQLG